MEAVRILGEAWEDEMLEAQGKKRSSTPRGMGEAVAVDPVGMPNVWDGEKEGTTHNAETFNRMLFNTR